MNNNYLLSLLTKYQDNVCTEAELQELQQWYALLNTSNQSIEDSKAEAFSDEMLIQFRKRLTEKTLVVPFYRRAFFRVSVAASIIMILSAGAYFQFFNAAKQSDIVKTNNTMPHDVTAPTRIKAMITLSDGRTVSLESVTSGTLATQGDVNVVKNTNGEIVYEGSSPSPKGDGRGEAYNTLTNPRGSKLVSLTLSDGTKVWLNAESSLRYPTDFVGSERNVEIKGEAYFEVARNAAMPFVVKKGDAAVKVLGTHFNVNAYEDEAVMKITLLEGSVNVFKGDNKRLLKPGQQAEINQQGNIFLNSNVDIDEVMAWKNDLFNFNSLQLQSIMLQIARWYDVEVAYEGKISEKHFSGIVSRNNNVSEVLKIMQLAGIKFKIEGKKVLVIY